MSAPRSPVEVGLRRAIDLRRYENTATNDVRRLLIQARDEVVLRLTRLDPTAVSAGYQRRRLEALQAQIEDTLHATFGDARTVTYRNLKDLLDVATETNVADFRRVVGSVWADHVRGLELSAAQLRAIVNEQVIQGGVLKDWWRELDRTTATSIQRQIRLGLTQSETIDQIVRRVRGTSVGGGRYMGGVFETTTRQATTIVRTAVNQVSSEAQRLVQERNKDVAPKYRYVATLDARTTPICRSLDGKEFEVADESAPRPPQHFGCRSRTVPVVDWKALGIDTSKVPVGERAAQGGPVSADTDYAGWLRDQPQSVQNEILGPTRAGWFRAGTVTLQDLVSREGRTLTIQELRQRI